MKTIKPPKPRRSSCAKCGERIRGSTFRFNGQTYCGLCVEDVLGAMGYGVNAKKP